MKKLKMLLAAAIPALSVMFTSAAQAQEAVQCYEATSLVTALRDQEGEVPTGDIARNQGIWESLELYADPKDGSWSLLGKPNAQGLAALGIPPGTDARCLLLGGSEGFGEVRQHPALIQLFGAPKHPVPAPVPTPK